MGLITIKELHIHTGDTAMLQKILDLLIVNNKNQQTIMADLSKLQADVAANGDAVASAVTLLQGLKAQLDAAGTDPVALKALSDSLEASTQSLADAVTANTPAAPQV